MRDLECVKNLPIWKACAFLVVGKFLNFGVSFARQSQRSRVERNMAVVTVQVGAQIQWLATYNPTSRRWIGICDPMNLTMEADSLDELHSVIEEGIQLMLRDLLEDNELDAYLRDMGWSAPIPHGQLPQNIEFDVPWQLVAEKARGFARSSA
jgi:hypothetical protein